MAFPNPPARTNRLPRPTFQHATSVTTIARSIAGDIYQSTTGVRSEKFQSDYDADELRRHYLALITSPTWKQDLVEIAKDIEEQLSGHEELTMNDEPRFHIVTKRDSIELNQHIFTVGRKKQCDVQLRSRERQEEASRVHIIVFVWDDKVVVVDPGSLAGVETVSRVNGTQPRLSSRLGDRKTLVFGRHEAFVLRLGSFLVTASPRECVVCFERHRQVKLACHHFVLCEPCFRRIAESRNPVCPLCRVPMRIEQADLSAHGVKSCVTWE